MHYFILIETHQISYKIQPLPSTFNSPVQHPPPNSQSSSLPKSLETSGNFLRSQKSNYKVFLFFCTVRWLENSYIHRNIWLVAVMAKGFQLHSTFWLTTTTTTIITTGKPITSLFPWNWISKGVRDSDDFSSDFWICRFSFIIIFIALSWKSWWFQNWISEWQYIWPASILLHQVMVHGCVPLGPGYANGQDHCIWHCIMLDNVGWLVGWLCFLHNFATSWWLTWFYVWLFVIVDRCHLLLDQCRPPLSSCHNQQNYHENLTTKI